MHDRGAYRDAEEVTRRRRDEALLRWRERAAALDPEVVGVYARRAARIAAGKVAALGFVLMAIASVRGPEGVQTNVLLCTWAAATVVYFLERAAARNLARRRLSGVAVATLDPWADLDRYAAATPSELLRGLAGALEARSVSWALVGLCLLVPLSIHFLIYLPFLTDADCSLEDFNVWIALSLVSVGHCHLIVARRAWRFGTTMAPREGWRAYGAAVLGCTLSGFFVTLFFDPRHFETVVFAPIAVAPVVAITGLFVPGVFDGMRNRIHAERAILG